MPEIIFNYQPLKFGKSLAQPQVKDFPILLFKNTLYDYAIKNTSSYVKEVLSLAPITHKRKNIVVDIKVHDIETGKFPCLPGWHCDTVIDPFHESPGEIHHIFVTGGSSLTEFISEPVKLNIPNKTTNALKIMRDQLETKVFDVKSLPSCQFVTYGRWDFHRASAGKYPERRLLVRVTETDIIKPKLQKFSCKNYG